MRVSVGMLYSAQRLLQLIADTSTTVAELLGSFRRIEVAESEAVILLAQQCQWISLGAEGALRLTDQGRDILSGGPPAQQLRHQLKHVVHHLNPSWAKRIPNGRRETIRYLPDDIEQIFEEAGLLEVWDDTLLSFWDDLGLAVRAQRNEINFKIGRAAERLTVGSELKRTKREPTWISRDTTFAGYDVLSVVDETDASLLRIEVKGSSLPVSDAYFFVSRHEWEVASDGKAYWFYLWILRDVSRPECRFVRAVDVATHIANDQGDGKWDVVKIPFKCFWKSGLSETATI